MPAKTSQKVQDRVFKKFDENKCEFISFEVGRKVRYKCSCGNVTQSTTPSISSKTWKGCSSCSNRKRGNINTLEYARLFFEKDGHILHDQEYINGKTKLKYTCFKCKQEASTSFSDYKRGRKGCKSCRSGKDFAIHNEKIRYRI